MFQKIKPMDDNAAVTAVPTPSSTPVNPNAEQKTERSMSESNPTTTDNELSDLRSNNTPSTAYSPRPAPSAGFSTFPSRPMGAPAASAPVTSSYGAMSTTSTAEGRRLVIGEGINISGEIDACHHLVVEGQVEATLKGASILDIAESGTFYGSVEITEATIAGRFEGDLKVDGRLTVRSTGIIIGSLSYRELAVETGATIEGKITPLNSKASTRGTNPSTKSSSSSSSASKRPGTTMDNELPFATKAAS